MYSIQTLSSSSKGWVLGAAVKSTAANDSFNSFKSIWQLVLTGREQTLILSNHVTVELKAGRVGSVNHWLSLLSHFSPDAYLSFIQMMVIPHLLSQDRWPLCSPQMGLGEPSLQTNSLLASHLTTVASAGGKTSRRRRRRREQIKEEECLGKNLGMINTILPPT